MELLIFGIIDMIVWLKKFLNGKMLVLLIDYIIYYII